MSDGLTYLTVTTNSHLGYAITLAKSLFSAMPGTRLRIYVADSWEPAILPKMAEAEFIAANSAGLEGYGQMATRYSAFEFTTALKAPCILHALHQTKGYGAVYLDSDIEVLGSLSPVAEKLKAGTDCILTPHITSPFKAPDLPDEDSYLLAGIFNLGFAAFSNRAPSIKFLNWWAAKKRNESTTNDLRGLFVDQSYCNLAPAFIEKFEVLRDPGYNLAYWNLSQRELSKDHNGNYFANNMPVRFVHFSGASIQNPDIVSKHQSRFTKANAGLFADMLGVYLAKVDANDIVNGSRYSRMVWSHAKPATPAIALPAHIVLERSIYSFNFILANLARRVLFGKRRLAEYWRKRGL